MMVQDIDQERITSDSRKKSHRPVMENRKHLLYKRQKRLLVLHIPETNMFCQAQ